MILSLYSLTNDNFLNYDQNDELHDPSEVNK